MSLMVQKNKRWKELGVVEFFRSFGARTVGMVVMTRLRTSKAHQDTTNGGGGGADGVSVGTRRSARLQSRGDERSEPSRSAPRRSSKPRSNKRLAEFGFPDRPPKRSAKAAAQVTRGGKKSGNQKQKTGHQKPKSDPQQPSPSVKNPTPSSAEGPLKVEQFFAKAKGPVDPEKRFRAWEMEVKSAVRQRGGRAAAYAHETFVKQVLEGGGPRQRICYSEAECLEASRKYVASLRLLYPDLILDPYVFSEDKLKDYETDWKSTEDMEVFKLMNRRFVVWRPSEEKRGKWDDSMERVWGRLFDNMSATTYGEVESNSEEATEMSCLITKTKWKDGAVVKEPVEDSATLNGLMNDVLHASNNGKLYFTDGTMPNYNEKDVPMDAPGLSCAVNDGANGMLPLMLRSDRPESMFNFMKVESTGTSTFTFFLPLGCGANMTAFHFETKRLRSLNCGTGDLIFQPLATEGNLRKMERIHRAILGKFERHGQLLPIEMYLEEGIEIVAYIRDKGYAECVELPLLSSHAFISHGTIFSTPPPYKVSCNDVGLRKEPLAAYFLEEIAKGEKEEMLGGEKQRQADTWMESVYLRKCDYNPSSKSPWLGEIAGQRKCEYPGSERDNRSQNMETCVIRLAERLLDQIDSRLKKSVLTGGPDKEQATEALKSLLPALYNVLNAVREGGSSRMENREGITYIQKLIKRVEALVEVKTPLMDVLKMTPRKRSQFVEECVARGSLLPEGVQVSSFQGAWRLWCMALFIHCETLRQGRQELLAGAQKLRKEVEKTLEKVCTDWAEKECSQEAPVAG